MTSQRQIYLDNSATTRISDEALAKYNEVSRNLFGNPSSLHSLGLMAEKEIDKARAAILSSLSAKDSTVIFTASGSESNNLAIIGRALSKERYKKGAKIITSAGEHASVSEPIARLRDAGFKTAEIPTKNGRVDLEALEREMTPDVILVSIMLVNNETGALYDLAAVSKIMRKNSKEALLHVDATQAYCKVKFTKQSIFADMITISSHKIEGPKGVGALVVDNKVLSSHGLSPLIFGGGQEGGLRSGTENVPAIAAFGEAVRIGYAELSENEKKLLSLRSYLVDRLRENLPSVSITVPEKFAPHIVNITLPKIKSETMLHYLSSLGIYVSSGSACSSNFSHKSSALIAYGRSESEADFSIRISLSKRNTEEDIDALIDGLMSGISRLARVK